MLPALVGRDWVVQEDLTRQLQPQQLQRPPHWVAEAVEAPRADAHECAGADDGASPYEDRAVDRHLGFDPARPGSDYRALGEADPLDLKKN